MKKEEARLKFQDMFLDWSTTKTPDSLKNPGYYEFRAWVQQKECGDFFNFRSVAGPDEDVRRWFIDFFKQNYKY